MADDCIVIYNNFTSKFCLVANDATVTYNNVVGNMYTFHQEVIVANYGLALSCCSTIDGHIFTDGIVVTHLGCGLLTSEFQVLGNGTNDCSWEYGVAIADARQPSP